MEKTELYLLTAFACMACDGDIAVEEINLIKELNSAHHLFGDLDVETTLNHYVDELNNTGKPFIKKYLNALSDTPLDTNEQIKILDIAIRTIEADNVIQYSEVSFFKKIRSRLSITDEQILHKFPDKEDYLLPDIVQIDKDDNWDVKFSHISFNL